MNHFQREQKETHFQNNVQNYKEQQQQQNKWESFEKSQQFSDELEMSLDEINNKKEVNYRNVNPQNMTNNLESWNNLNQQQSQQYDPHNQYNPQYHQEQYMQNKNDQFQKKYQQQENQYQNYYEKNQNTQQGQQGESAFQQQIQLTQSDNQLNSFDDQELPGKGQQSMIQILRFNQNYNKFEFNYLIGEYLERFNGKYQFVTLVSNNQQNNINFMSKLVQIHNTANLNMNDVGIYMYSHPVLYERENIYVFFLICNNISPNEQMNMRVLSFSTIFSSYILYLTEKGNTVNTLQEMEPLTQLCNILKVTQSSINNDNKWNTYWEDDLGIQYFLPNLGIVFLNQEVESQKIESNHELEQMLSIGQKDSKIFGVKQFIKKFKDREGFQISSFSNNKSTQEIQQLKLRLQVKGVCKEINGIALNSRMVLNLCSYITAQLKLQTIKISYDLAWDYIVKNECIYGYNEALLMDIARKFEDLYTILKQTREVALQQFYQIAGIRQKNEYYTRYKIEIQNVLNQKEIDIFNINDQLSYNQNNKTLQELIQPIKKKLKSGKEYYNVQNIDKFTNDFSKFLNHYEEQSVGSNTAESMIEFLIEFHPDLIYQLLNQISIKYDDDINQEIEECTQDEIFALEQKIEQYEQKISIAEQENQKINEEKKTLEQKVNTLKQEQQQQEAQQLQNQDTLVLKKQNEQTIAQLKRDIEELQKPKKGCCGCFS